MRDLSGIAKHISSLCPGKWDRQYIRSKILSDPLYEGVYQQLKKRTFPLIDIGCGLSILGLYLRERNWSHPIVGFDYDSRKIAEGKKLIISGGYENIELIQGDARVDLPAHVGDVTILDILQFFETDQQEVLLRLAAKKVCPGGKLIIRSGINENNFRFFLTWLGDVLAKCLFWMKAGPTHYPTAEFLQTILADEGLTVEVTPYWGKTPFNNYLIVATRKEDQ